jgi:hypothetical protein
VAKLRDAAALMVEAYTEYLNSQAPDEPKNSFDRLKWTQKEGSKGPYEQLSDDKSEAFKILRDKVTEHGGFWNNGTYKYWFHSGRPDMIDRRAVS